MDKREKDMIHEMYRAYLIQCKFLSRLKEIHEEWATSKKKRRDIKELLDKVHSACQHWYQRRVDRGAAG